MKLKPRKRHDDTVTDERHDHTATTERPVRDEHVVGDEAAYDRFGGANWGAAFFGWLVAVGMTALLTGILAALATAVGYSQGITQSDAEREAGTFSLVTALVLLGILLIAYYAGGYVAGRMSRFDGGKQGVAVWLIGLIVTLIAVALGVVFGREYNILERVSLPTMPIPTDTLTWGGAITAAAILVGTLLAAMGGGKVGTHYHSRVDNAGYRY